MSNAKHILSTAIISTVLVTASSCTSDAFYKIGDMLQEAEHRLASQIKQYSETGEMPATEDAGPDGFTDFPIVADGSAPLGQDGLTVPVTTGQPGAEVTMEDVDLAELMAYFVMLSEQSEYDANGYPTGYPIDPTQGYGAYPGYGQPVYGQVGYPQQGAWPQGYGSPQGQGNDGWVMPSDGSLPMVNYDSNAYSNPESAYYDPYEVDSEGWSGGAYENPSSTYYDTGSYDTGSFSSFDSYDY